MNKLVAIISMALIVAAAGAGYYFGFDHGWERSDSDQIRETDSTSFLQSGRITRNAAHVSEPWYIEYEVDDNPVREKLGFEGDAICSRNDEAINCADFEIRANDIAKVTGKRMSDYIAVSKFEVTTSGAEPTTTDTFKETKEYGFYGTITLTGYIDVQRRVCNPGDMCSETVDYVNFVFTDGNEAMKKFTGQNTGNSFVAGDRIGIGCQQVTQARIYSINDADSGTKESVITGTDYVKLIASSKTNMVKLKMTREIYTSGRGAPDCYSHFRDFDVL